MAKQPALSTQLKNAQALIIKLEQDLKNKTDQAARNYQIYQEKEAELDQLHAFFDALPDGATVPRRNEQTYKDYSAMTRLAAWLASK